ncbi:MAG TPA: O-methyltransferase, partial [Candidatus Krumholzibacteria bacterium]|nr:O-methyltransferase [Candidatus Krumholzibacteria bacterium]
SQGKLLHVLARGVGARRILEIGTLGGYSGIWLARALPHGGTLVTIEVNEAHARVARRNFDRAGVTPRIEMRVGRALEVLPTLVNEHQPPFDLVFIDADKTEYADYLERSIPLCRSGSLIVADNVVRNGTVVDGESPDPLVRGVRRFMAVVAGDRRVTATALQTVGVKGYDGFAVIVVV